MLNRELEVTLNLAFKEARAKRHEFMTVEHLLLALLDNEAAATVLRAWGANLDKLRHDLHEFIDSTTPLIPQHDEAYARLSARTAARGFPCAKLRQTRGDGRQRVGGHFQ